MKAEDTVIDKEIYELSGREITLLNTQAEISFKAGIREVVEWIKSRPIRDVYDEDYHDGAKRLRLYEIGDTELGEWGIEDG